MLGISTIFFLFFLLATYAIFLVVSRKQLADQERLEQRVREALQETLDGSEGAIKIVREDTIGGNATIHRLLSSLNLMNRLDLMIKQADVQITVYKLLLFCVLAGIMAGLAAATILNLIAVVVFAGIAAAVPILHIARTRQKRLREFNSQLPDTLDLLSRSLAVGHAFSESLHQVAMEMPDPVATEFRITFEEQKLGLSTKLALDRLTQRVPIADLRLCVTAMHIQRETGGNLAEILEKVAQTIRDRFKLMEDFRTMTTSSRASAWILCGLPFALVFVLTALNPAYMSKLVNDPRGHYVIAVAIVMQLIGMVMIKGILSIKI